MVETLNAVDAFDAKWFAELKPACDDGSVLAVLEGLIWCHQHTVTPPAWFLMATSGAITKLLLGRDKKVGRAASGLNRERELLKRFMRWDLVHEAKRGRDNFRRERDLLRQYPKARSARHKQHVQMVVERLGRNVEDLFAFVSWQVENTPLAGGPDAIKASYQRVERDMRSERTAAKYYAFSYQAIKAAGMSDIFDAVPAKKCPAFLPLES